MLTAFNGGGVLAGRFSGQTPWVTLITATPEPTEIAGAADPRRA
ncbi:MAG TPA: hypothetical protein VJU81_24170 [Methylomirabilota bacterium]|nr:hypothetical protein [Methylomirabilota bacterium]